jgi:Flp pilus assembly protein TadD
MRTLFLLLLGLLCAGCATKRMETVDVHPLFADGHFAVRPVPSTAEIFAVNAEMESFLNRLAGDFRREGKPYGLAQALSPHGALKVAYESGVTHTAIETFGQRAGNCLSLVVMAGALASHVGLNVRYYQVRTPDLWSREGDLLMGNKHVNISLGPGIRERRVREEGARVTIDFLPPEDLFGQVRREIDENTVVAMFHNNRAAEHLVEDRYDEAYWAARTAILTDPGFVPAFNTLGVIYRQAGQLSAARRVFDRALDLEPENATVLSNLERVLRAQGDTVAAARVAARLSALEPQAPYHFYFQATAALQRQDYSSARKAFERELQRDSTNPEAHFGLAVTLAQLGDLTGARQHLAMALENSTTGKSRRIYTAKLERLRALDAR